MAGTRFGNSYEQVLREQQNRVGLEEARYQYAAYAGRDGDPMSLLMVDKNVKVAEEKMKNTVQAYSAGRGVLIRMRGGEFPQQLGIDEAYDNYEVIGGDASGGLTGAKFGAMFQRAIAGGLAAEKLATGPGGEFISTRRRRGESIEEAMGIVRIYDLPPAKVSSADFVASDQPSYAQRGREEADFVDFVFWHYEDAEAFSKSPNLRQRIGDGPQIMNASVIGTSYTDKYVESIDEKFRTGTASHFNALVTEWAERVGATVDWQTSSRRGQVQSRFVLDFPYDPATIASDDIVEFNGLVKQFGVGYKYGSGNTFIVETESVHEAVDTHAVNELILFIDNDADLYRQQFTPIIKNILKKRKRGVYDHRKAPKLWLYLVDNGAKKYAKEFGTPGVPWHQQWPKATRMAAAQELADRELGEIELGNYDSLIESTLSEYEGSPVDVARKREAALKQGIINLAKKYRVGPIDKGKLRIDARGNIMMLQQMTHPSGGEYVQDEELPDNLRKLALEYNRGYSGPGEISGRWITLNHFDWEKLLRDEGLMESLDESYSHSFSPDFYGDVYDAHKSRRPTNVADALASMDDDEWDDMAQAVFGIPGDRLGIDDVMPHIIDTDTVGNLDSPVEVYIDRDGYHTVLVYDIEEQGSAGPGNPPYPSDDRPSAAVRGYGHGWRKTREAYLEAHPVCEADGCEEASTTVHHKLPISEGGNDDEDNLEARCAGCHNNLKTGTTWASKAAIEEDFSDIADHAAKLLRAGMLNDDEIVNDLVEMFSGLSREGARIVVDVARDRMQQGEAIEEQRIEMAVVTVHHRDINDLPDLIDLAERIDRTYKTQQKWRAVRGAPTWTHEFDFPSLRQAENFTQEASALGHKAKLEVMGGGKVGLVKDFDEPFARRTRELGDIMGESIEEGTLLERPTPEERIRGYGRIAGQAAFEEDATAVRSERERAKRTGDSLQIDEWQLLFNDGYKVGYAEASGTGSTCPKCEGVLNVLGTIGESVKARCTECGLIHHLSEATVVEAWDAGDVRQAAIKGYGINSPFGKLTVRQSRGRNWKVTLNPNWDVTGRPTGGDAPTMTFTGPGPEAAQWINQQFGLREALSAADRAVRGLPSPYEIVKTIVLNMKPGVEVEAYGLAREGDITPDAAHRALVDLADEGILIPDKEKYPKWFRLAESVQPRGDMSLLTEAERKHFGLDEQEADNPYSGNKYKVSRTFQEDTQRGYRFVDEVMKFDDVVTEIVEGDFHKETLELSGRVILKNAAQDRIHVIDMNHKDIQPEEWDALMEAAQTIR